MDHAIVYAELDRVLGAPRFARLYGEVKARFLAHEGIGHNFEHVRRVVVNAAHLCIEENADPDIVMAAAILHDIGFMLVPSEPKKHHLHGASGCHSFLGEWTPAEREVISKCILKHKGRYPGYAGPEPETLEEKVVCDADQVDKFGWVGLLQALKVYAEYGHMGMEKFKTLAGLADGLSEAGKIHLYTESARRFAQERAEPDLTRASLRLKEELSFYQGFAG
ncbi:MAG TPA: HD domain-containing protein [Anaeromyxobacter sp.]|nr:HD domain-containing protein [Anaeromyxobacter sp.]